MSTATLTSLLEYLTGTLTPSDMRWVSKHLAEYADSHEQPHQPKRYTKEELNAMLDEAEREIASGEGIPDEDVWRKYDEEFAREEELEMAEAI